MAKKKNKKKINSSVIGFLGIGLIALLSVFGLYQYNQSKVKEDTTVSSTKHSAKTFSTVEDKTEESSEIETTPSSSVSIFSADESVKEVLEQPDKPLSEEQASTARQKIQATLEEVVQYPDTTQPSLVGLTNTDSSFLQSFYTGMSTGYTLDYSTISVFRSDTDGIFQYTVRMLKEGSDDVILSGYYSVASGSVSMTNVSGSFTGILF